MMSALSSYSLGRVLLVTAVVGLVMLLVDIMWLRLRAGMYRSAVARVQGKPLRVRAGWGAVAYVIMVASIPLVAVPAASDRSPALGQQLATPASAAYSGALLGLTVYGVFNATNAAIFAEYPASVAIQDTLWGTALFAASSALFVTLLQRL
jgi:uncharacterized membrane protein